MWLKAPQETTSWLFLIVASYFYIANPVIPSEGRGRRPQEEELLFLVHFFSLLVVGIWIADLRGRFYQTKKWTDGFASKRPGAAGEELLEIGI
jgi:hypothetical protein